MNELRTAWEALGYLDSPKLKAEAIAKPNHIPSSRREKAARPRMTRV